MNKLARRIVPVGISAAIVGSTLLAAGGSASAATLPDGGSPRAAVVEVKPDARYTPWIADQLAIFAGQRDGAGYGARDVDVRFDPWVADQLAIFVDHDGPHHHRLGRNWHHYER
ncbi:hypothetical protein ABZ746_37350 [Streptomyces sp. NPDC020096]